MLLMYARIARDIDSAEVIFDFVQHIVLGSAEGARYFGIDAQHRLPGSIGFAFPRQPSRLFENFVTNRLRRFYKSRTLAIRTRRAERAFERLLNALSGHDDQAEVVER